MESDSCTILSASVKEYPRVLEKSGRGANLPSFVDLHIQKEKKKKEKRNLQLTYIDGPERSLHGRRRTISSITTPAASNKTSSFRINLYFFLFLFHYHFIFSFIHTSIHPSNHSFIHYYSVYEITLFFHFFFRKRETLGKASHNITLEKHG